MIVGLGIKLKSVWMSMRSWKWTSLRLSQNPDIAARVLLKRANLSFFVLKIFMLWQMHIAPCVLQLFFLPVFCWLLLHSGTIRPLVVKKRIEWRLSGYHSLVVLILFFMLLVDHCQRFPRIGLWVWGRMCDPYVKVSFLTAIPQSSHRDISNLTLSVVLTFLS